MKKSFNSESQVKAAETILSAPSAETTTAYFMDALRLSQMLQWRAIEDLEVQAKAAGASEEAIAKLKKDVISLARTTPIDKCMLTKTCMRVAGYLAKSIPSYKRDMTSNLSKKTAALKNVISDVDKKRNQTYRFDAGMTEPISASIPRVVFGKRKDLDCVISHILDCAENNLQNCLHLSVKSYNKKFNKYYRKIHPDDWTDKLRSKDGLFSLIKEASKLTPLKLLLVDELCHGFNPKATAAERRLGSKIGRKGRYKEALCCFKRCRTNTSGKGICTISFHSTDSNIGDQNQEVTKSFYDLGSPFYCLSDSKSVWLVDRLGNVTLTIARADHE